MDAVDIDVEIGEWQEYIGETGGRYRWRVLPDEDPGDSPRDWAALSVMVLAHRRYFLPSEGEHVDEIARILYSYPFEKALVILRRWLTTFHGAIVVLPVWGYEHGQFSLKAGERTYPYNDRWDSGLAGIVYDRAKDIDPSLSPEQIEAAISAELADYDQWARDDVFLFEVQKASDGDIDNESGWADKDAIGSYYGVKDAAQAAIASIHEMELK